MGRDLLVQPALWQRHWKVDKKASESAAVGATVVMLLPARTDTKWFHEYICGKAEIRFIEGRLKFGGAKNNAPFPSMIVVLRRRYNEKKHRKSLMLYSSKQTAIHTKGGRCPECPPQEGKQYELPRRMKRLPSWQLLPRGAFDGKNMMCMRLHV